MNHELVTSWTEETIILIWWKGYSSTHDSWEDATEVRAPALMKEYYQRKFTAVWTIKIDQGVHSLATSTPPSALFTPIISISSITFMNDDAQQRSLIDPWTGNLLSPIITNVNMWWNDPSLWPMPNNSLNDNGGGGARPHISLALSPRSLMKSTPQVSPQSPHDPMSQTMPLLPQVTSSRQLVQDHQLRLRTWQFLSMQGN